MQLNKPVFHIVAVLALMISYARADIAIIVNKHLAPYIEYELNWVISDLGNVGVGNVIVNNTEFDDTSSKVALRNRLNDYYANNSIAGAILIGDFPVAEYEIEYDYTYGYARFPIDLYYMDLNGTWSDSASWGDNRGI